MKNLITLIFAGLFVSTGFANNAQLVVEKVDNGGAVPGNTYKIYVQILDAGNSLHAVFGDDQNSMGIQCDASFYQNPYGGQTSVDVNAQMSGLAPEVAFDSWVTIGAENSDNNNLWDVGIDFDTFNGGGELAIEDGAWFLVPTDAFCHPTSGSLILIAQLTTEGVASGSVNVQGWTADKQAWQEREMTFVTTNAHTFGCMDATATNYSADATYNDGTCEFSDVTEENDVTPTQSDVAPAKGDVTWQVFPNPIWEGQFNIQFSEVVDGKGNIVVDIIDNSGKLVHSQEINDGMVIGGNKIIVTKDLPSGVYNVNVRRGDQSSVQQIIVQK